MAAIHDIAVENHGSLLLVEPLTEAAADWIEQNVQDEAQFWGHKLVVEPRYLHDLLYGIRDAGLLIEGEPDGFEDNEENDPEV